MEEMIRIYIICSNKNKFLFKSSLLAKVVELKKYLAEISDIPDDEFSLTYKGKTLKDDQTLESYGFQDNHLIYMELAHNPLFTMTETSPPSDTTTGGEMIMIEIIYVNGDIFSVRSSVGSKVADFKVLLAEVYHVPAKEQRLIYRGRTLEDDRTLESYGLKEYHTIHMDNLIFSPTRVMPDISLLYPAIFQMTQTLLSSPQLREQIIDHPEVRSMFDSNPELSVMIQNQEVVRCPTSPQMMQVYTTCGLLYNGMKNDVTIYVENPLSAEAEPPSDTTTGDLASPGLDRPTGGSMPDKKSMLLYDVMSEMMQTLLYSPKVLKQIIDQTPRLHDSIPEMMQNPDVDSVFRWLTSPPMMQQMMSSPLLPELHQYPSGILPPGATPVPLEQLFEAQLKHLQETRDPDT